MSTIFHAILYLFEYVDISIIHFHVDIHNDCSDVFFNFILFNEQENNHIIIMIIGLRFERVKYIVRIDFVS